MRISKDYRRLNLAANILVVVTVTTLAGLFTYRTFFQPTLASLEAGLLKAGSDFKGLPEVNFSKSPNTILLVADIKCQFFAQAFPFYKKLIAESKGNSDVRVLFISENENEQVERYLREQDVNVEFIPNVDLVKLKVDATPTIIWVDADRKIVGSYQGLFQEKQESAFFEVYHKTLSGK